MNTIRAVILAGGQARRMGGGDKCLLELDGGTILRRIIDRLSPQVQAIALNANGDPARFAGFGLPVLKDPIKDHPGPLAGILAGMDWAKREGSHWLLTVAGDTPFFPETLCERLMSAATVQDAKVVLAATHEGERLFRHPTFGLWSVDLKDDLAAAIADGTRKIVIWSDQFPNATVTFDDCFQNGLDPFFNINSPEDLAKARAHDMVGP